MGSQGAKCYFRVGWCVGFLRDLDCRALLARLVSRLARPVHVAAKGESAARVQMFLMVS